MSNAAVLERIRRLKEHSKREARARLAAATDARLQHEAHIADRETMMTVARSQADDGDTAHLTSTHVFLLHQELGRRQAEVQLGRMVDEEARCRHLLAEALREEQTVEKLIERRREEEAREAMRRETADLDEHAGRAWWRRNA